MKIYNEAGQIIDMSQVDLTVGKLMTTKRIKDDASPIDNVTKFAWGDEDYEDVQVFYPTTAEQEVMATELDKIQAQVSYTAMKTGTLIGG